MPYIPYGKLKITEIIEGQLLYYQASVKHVNQRSQHKEDITFLVSEIGEYIPSEDEETKIGDFVHGQCLSGTLMGAEINNISIEDLAEIPNE